MMVLLVSIYIFISHIFYRTHITYLRRKIWIELVAQKNNPYSSVWNLNRLYIIARLQLRPGKRIVDIPNIYIEIRVG
jgi:hypothetical protein